MVGLGGGEFSAKAARRCTNQTSICAREQMHIHAVQPVLFWPSHEREEKQQERLEVEPLLLGKEAICDFSRPPSRYPDSCKTRCCVADSRALWLFLPLHYARRVRRFALRQLVLLDL